MKFESVVMGPGRTGSPETKRGRNGDGVRENERRKVGGVERRSPSL